MIIQFLALSIVIAVVVNMILNSIWTPLSIDDLLMHRWFSFIVGLTAWSFFCFFSLFI